LLKKSIDSGWVGLVKGEGINEQENPWKALAFMKQEEVFGVVSAGGSVEDELRRRIVQLEAALAEEKRRTYEAEAALAQLRQYARTASPYAGIDGARIIELIGDSDCGKGWLPPEKAKQLKDAAEMLWSVLANVSNGDWKKQSEEWQTAAARWRDNYFAALAETEETK